MPSILGESDSENKTVSSSSDTTEIQKPIELTETVAPSTPPEKAKLVRKDVTNGLERLPIPLIVTEEYLQDDQPLPPAPLFSYRKANQKTGKGGRIMTVSLDASFCEDDMPACECEEDCEALCLCNFRNSSAQQVYKDGRLNVLSHEELGELDPIHECTPRCPCPPHCPNRLVQAGISVKLEVFYAGPKGWALRVCEDVPRGTFICEYAGLFRKRASKNALDDSYFMQHKAWRSTWIDAREYGNVGRFINHSCSPNLTSIRVMWDSTDPNAAHIALFSAEDIFAGQELTIDYGESYWAPKHAKDPNFLCKCGEPDCRFGKPEQFIKEDEDPEKKGTPGKRKKTLPQESPSRISKRKKLIQ